MFQNIEDSIWCVIVRVSLHIKNAPSLNCKRVSTNKPRSVSSLTEPERNTSRSRDQTRGDVSRKHFLCLQNNCGKSNIRRGRLHGNSSLDVSLRTTEINGDFFSTRPQKQLNELLTPLMLGYGEFGSEHGTEPNPDLNLGFLRDCSASD